VSSSCSAFSQKTSHFSQTESPFSSVLNVNSASPVSKEKTTQELEKELQEERLERKMEEVVEEFAKWDHSLRNKFVSKLYRKFHAPQLHLVSSLLELESGYPTNKRDILQWLPAEIALKILSYLDFASLCHCSQVLLFLGTSSSSFLFLPLPSSSFHFLGSLSCYFSGLSCLVSDGW